MRWVKLDPAMFENPQVRQLSDKAFRMYVQAILWTAYYQRDGIVTESAVSSLLGRRKWRMVVAELHAAGLIHFAGEPCDSCDEDVRIRRLKVLQSGDWHIHEYLRFNLSNHEIRRRQERDRGYKKRRSERRSSPDGPTTFRSEVPIGKNVSTEQHERAPAPTTNYNYPLTHADSPPSCTGTDARDGGNATPSHLDDLIATVRGVRPFWSPKDIARAADACAATGRTPQDTLAALLRVAVDPRTSHPNRVVADGPWWRPITDHGETESKSDARIRRTIALGERLERERLEREALERRAGMRALDGGTE